MSSICIYGDSPAAVAAAIQASRDGYSVVIVTPELHVGGMLVEGLGSSDIGNHDFDNSIAIGGIAREFYQRIGDAYGYTDFGFYQFEPHVAERRRRVLHGAAQRKSKLRLHRAGVKRSQRARREL